MSDDYIHGFAPAEQRRLTLMQGILNDEELRHLDLDGVRRILDVGSGLGQMTRALARAAGPAATVVGVERDERQLEEAVRQAEGADEASRVEFRQGRAERLPLTPGERGSFDLAHCRFLLEHVTDPLAVVREMVGAVRAGGRIVLIDDDHELLRLWPVADYVEQVWRIYWESYRDRGHDPLIGRRLAGLLREAGARPTRVTSVFYGAVRGMRLFDPVVDNLASVLGGAAERLDEEGVLARPAMEQALAELDEWRHQASATLWYSLPLAEGTVG
ncbi:MAG TPA: methyltransferase domain-containing protein [Candidatus Polarisedimenticolaceae bacterium]|nr:methyltransferase domain-containing protein [Candidatus Polarisedimenticolaceae bacterium]